MEKRNMTNLILVNDKKSVNCSKNEVTERYNFFTMCKKRNQSIDNYIIQLRNQAKTCNFGNLTDSLIRDKIILELQDKRLHEKLFNAKNLDLLTLISIFNEHKHSIQRKQTINNDNANIVDNTSVINKNYCRKANNTINDNKFIDKTNIPPKKCKNCNYVHLKNVCPALGFKCEKCNMYNHFTNCCRSECINNDNKMSPSAPPLDNVLYPNLDYMKTFQTNMVTTASQDLQNLKKGIESLKQNCNLTTKTSDIKINNDNIKTKEKCCIS